MMNLEALFTVCGWRITGVPFGLEITEVVFSVLLFQSTMEVQNPGAGKSVIDDIPSWTAPTENLDGFSVYNARHPPWVGLAEEVCQALERQLMSSKQDPSSLNIVTTSLQP
jgi:hypothetical protein